MKRKVTGTAPWSKVLLHLGKSAIAPAESCDAEATADDAPAPAPAPASTPTQRSRHVAVMVILLGQLLWAVAIPLKNVIVMPYPKVAPDAQHISSGAYNNSLPGGMTRRVPGGDVYRIVHEVVHLSLNNSDIRRLFLEKGDFAVDDVAALLSPEQSAIFAQYYGLVFQASEFPASGFVPTTIKAWAPIEQNDSRSTNRLSNWTEITITCPEEWDVLQGMTCTDEHGDPCDDSAWNDVSNLQFEAVDLRSLPPNAGWHNKASLVSFVTMTHNLMRSVFAKRDWEKALTDNQEEQIVLSVLDDNKTINYTDGSTDRIIMPTPWDSRDVRSYLAQGYRRFQSCMGTELVLTFTFAKMFAVDIVQTALLQNDIFNAKALQTFDMTRIQSQWQEIFRFDMVLTSSAGFISLVQERHMLWLDVMTESTIVDTNFKRDRAMTGTMHMGHSGRNLAYMSYYPDSYYSFLNNSIIGDTVYAEWRQLGAYFAGYNGFKFDFTRNTMVVQRLSERTKSEGTGYAEDWFEQEKQVAKWYRNHELNDPASLLTMADKIWGTDAPSHEHFYLNCLEGFYRKLAQTALIMALRLQPVINHVAFQSMSDPDSPNLWFSKQMLMNEIVGENIGGYRVSFPYPRDDGQPTTGSAWPLVPLLSAFARELGPEIVVQEFMTEMNKTFLNLVEVEFGRFNFRDAVHCPFGFATLGVEATDEKDELWSKVYAQLWLHGYLSDLTLSFALGASIQGMGLITMDGIVIMALSCLPMIVSYHLPSDSKFLLAANSTPNSYVTEFWVLLSLTWYIRFGIELGSWAIKLKYSNWWFQHLITRMRFVILLVVCVVRLGIPVNGVNYNQGLVKVFVSCLLSILLGFLATVASVLSDKPPAQPQDALSELLTQRSFQRNKYGVLGQLDLDWSHSGMTLEGWKALKVNGRVDALVHDTTGVIPVPGTTTTFELEQLTQDVMQSIVARKRVPQVTLRRGQSRTAGPRRSDMCTAIQLPTKHATIKHESSLVRGLK